MKGGAHGGGVPKSNVKFQMPTAENLIPIRIDVEVEGQRFKDAFTWNPNELDVEITAFARRTVKDLNLPMAFLPLIAQSIQTQVNEFRSYEGLEMIAGERVHCLKLDLRVNNTVIRDQFLWDLGNLESNPEEFARCLCKDLELEDPEVGPAVAFAIREQLYELAVLSVSSGRETRISKKSRREWAMDFSQSRFDLLVQMYVGILFKHFYLAIYLKCLSLVAARQCLDAFELMKRSSSKSSAVRKKNEWDFFEPIVEILTKEEVEALEAREERNARIKKRQEEKDDLYVNRYSRT
ncbi:hypothetical protein L7F22_003887 [Adiantum nelumboides]|nr:hypothetical protein [Adiantum nelumboides]